MADEPTAKRPYRYLPHQMAVDPERVRIAAMQKLIEENARLSWTVAQRDREIADYRRKIVLIGVPCLLNVFAWLWLAVTR